MADSKTPQELNEAVAEKLRLMLCKYDHLGYGYLDEFKSRTVIFDPATDPAAALWAAKEFCKLHNLDFQTGWNIATDNHYCQMSPSGVLRFTVNEIGRSIPEAICRAIAGTGG